MKEFVLLGVSTKFVNIYDQEFNKRCVWGNYTAAVKDKEVAHSEPMVNQGGSTLIITIQRCQTFQSKLVYESHSH